MGVAAVSVCESVMSHLPPAAIARARRQARPALQGELATLLPKVPDFNPNFDHRIRWKMQRWRLSVPLGTLSNKPQYSELCGLGGQPRPDSNRMGAVC